MLAIMPGLTLIGPLAGKTRVPSSDPAAAAAEGLGLFVLGDAYAIRHYSGTHLGYRWLCRAQGPLVDRVGVWPTPGGHTGMYFTSREPAQAMYAQLRQHALAMTPGLRAEDARGRTIPLNDPSCHAESFFEGPNEVLRLFYDHMSDQQTAVRNTDAIWQFPAHPDDHRQGTLVAYFSQNDVMYVAVALSPNRLVEHICIIYSDSHKPEPTIPAGMPAAEWIRAYEKGTVSFPTGVAIAQWGRLSGSELQWAEDPQNPLGSLLGKLQSQPWAPLPAPGELGARLPGVPAGYAFRVEPGAYTTTYYELTTKDHGGYSFVSLSREGAESFLPVVLGNAGGMVHGGLTMEQYAMLSVERNNLLMRLGPAAVASAEMAALCQKWSQPVRGPLEIGKAGRVDGWELMIQHDAAFSAQWAMQLGIASLRLQGVEPNKAQIEQIAQQQQATQQALEQHHQQHKAREREVHQAALQLIEGARQWTVPQIVSAIPGFAPNSRPHDVLYHAIKILKNPDDYPRFDKVDQLTEKIAKAHWATMPEEDRKFEGNKEEKYVRDVIGDVYGKNGLPVPGLGGFLSRMLDKL